MSKKGFTTAILPIGGGMNDNLRPTKIRDNQATYIRNARIDGDAISNRPGYTTFCDLLANGSDINGLGVYWHNTSANRKIVLNYNDNLYYATPSSATWTAFTGADALITSDTDMNFVSWGNYLICMNGVDELGVVGITNSTTYEEPASATIKPLFGAAFTDQLFAAGVSTKENRIYYSRPMSFDKPEYIYDIGSSANGAGSNELDTAITAILSAHNRLYVFTKTTCYVTTRNTSDWDFSGAYPIPLFNPKFPFGCVSHRSACFTDNDVFFLTPENEIRSFRETAQGGTDLPAISDDIKKTMSELHSDQTNSFAVYQPNKRLVKFWVSTDGSINDRCLILDLSSNERGKPKYNWYIDDNKPMTHGVYYQGNLYVGSDIIGQVYTDEGSDYADDDDSNIVMEFRSKEYDFNNPTVRKRFRELRFKGEINDNTTVTIEIYIDSILKKEITIDSNDINIDQRGTIGQEMVGDEVIGGDDYAEDTEPFEFTKIIKFRETGKKIQYRIKNDGVGQRLRIYHAEAEFKVLDKLEHKVSYIN